MGLFKRSRPEPTPDPELPLTVDEAARLRDLVRTAFAEAGIETTVRSDHLEDDSGRTFGLWNIAAICKDAPQRQWPELVRNHVRLLANPWEDIEQLDEETLVASTHVRLVEAAVLEQGWHPRARLIGEDAAAILAIDLPETVSTPPESFWDARGGLDRWTATGRANLRALALSDELTHDVLDDGEGRGAFDVILGDSFFTASTALVLDDLLRRFRPEADRALGSLVVVPFRHQVAFRVLDGTEDAALALNNLFRFAMLGFSDAPAPVSPNVFWVRDDTWTQISRQVDGRPTVEVSNDLARALGMPGE